MFFFDKIGQNKYGTVAFRRKRAKEIAGLAVKYVTQKVDDNDNVVGRGGSLAINKSEFILNTDKGVLFRAKIDKMDASFLLSNDGVILTGPNLEKGGEVESLTVHFVYYRK
ncbi:MAG: hypothetical protein IKA74_07115 [Clostridia bacterium]|nr:hypothetical protein [Clostridia bacterium]